MEKLTLQLLTEQVAGSPAKSDSDFGTQGRLSRWHFFGQLRTRQFYLSV